MAGGEVVIFGVDTGGTFTDVYASDGRVLKVPSRPHNPAAAIIEALRSAGIHAGDALAHGTTVATNAVLERKGARTVLLTTAGFEDVLEIRRQNRPALYDLLARWPDPLVPRDRRLGVRERLDFEGHVLTPLDEEDLRDLLAERAVEPPEAVAVCLLFAYVCSDHELRVADVVKERWKDVPLSLSHRVAPQYGEYERTSTTVVNAYVMPVVRGYLQTLAMELGAMGVEQIHVMHSNGGLVGPSTLADLPVGTILSGPAAGVVGARLLAQAAGQDEIITFDMGGTSTDVAVVPGEILERDDGEVDTFPLLIPMLTIETVGAGGGSIARVDAGGGLRVGPESAGADPGPAAYGRGDAATVTDANLVLGRLSPAGLLGGTVPLDPGRARAAVGRIASVLGVGVEEAAWAIVRLVNSNMERAVRSVSLQRGFDPRRFTLFPFGGAGPMHAAELAEGLGIGRVLVPPFPGVMAALGLVVPDLRRDFFRTVLLRLRRDDFDAVEDAFDRLEDEARQQMQAEDTHGFGDSHLERLADLRYVGQSFELRLPYEPPRTLSERFHEAHRRRYGHTMPESAIEIVHLRVRATLPRLRPPHVVPNWPSEPRPCPPRLVWFGSSTGMHDVRAEESKVYWRPALPAGAAVAGPAVIEQYDTLTVVPGGWAATVDARFNLILERPEGGRCGA